MIESGEPHVSRNTDGLLVRSAAHHAVVTADPTAPLYGSTTAHVVGHGMGMPPGCPSWIDEQQRKDQA